MWLLEAQHNVVPLGLTFLIESAVVVVRTAKFITKISASFPQNIFMSSVRVSLFSYNNSVAFLVTVTAMAASYLLLQFPRTSSVTPSVFVPQQKV